MEQDQALTEALEQFKQEQSQQCEGDVCLMCQG